MMEVENGIGEEPVLNSVMEFLDKNNDIIDEEIMRYVEEVRFKQIQLDCLKICFPFHYILHGYYIILYLIKHNTIMNLYLFMF